MNKFKPQYCIWFCIFFLFGCGGSSEQLAIVKEKIPNKNIIVLLDLSDRLLSENQITDDRQLISSIYQQFKETVKKHYFVNSKDKFTLLIAPQTNENYDLRSILPKLQIDFEKIPIKERAKYFDVNTEKFLKSLKSVYDISMLNKSVKENFAGSDIWRFFNEQIKGNPNNYIQTDTSYQNYIFVITDGYFDFEDNTNKIQNGKKYTYSEPISTIARKRGTNYNSIFSEGYGLMPLDLNYNNVNIMVLGCNPKIDDQLEMPIIKSIWTNWLENMNINSNYEIHEKVSIAQTKSLLESFINKKKTKTSQNILPEKINKVEAQNSLPIQNKTQEPHIELPKSNTTKVVEIDSAETRVEKKETTIAISANKNKFKRDLSNSNIIKQKKVTTKRNKNINQPSNTTVRKSRGLEGLEKFATPNPQISTK